MFELIKMFDTKMFVFILIVIVTSVIKNVTSQECVVFNLEDDFEDTFVMGVGNCESHPAWRLDHYGDNTNLVSVPSNASTAFIYAEETISCVSTIDFEMVGGGEVETNVYMESGNSNAFINIILYQKNEGSDDTYIGNILRMDNEDVGWRLIQLTVPESETYTGYISVMGLSSGQSRLKVDYIRYTSPNIEKESCVIYNEDTEPTEPTTIEPTSNPTTDESTISETTSIFTTEETTTTEPSSDPSTFEPTTVNPITDDSSTSEPTSIFTTETTTTEPSSDPSTFEPTTVNPITDDSSTSEPTSIFTTETTTTKPSSDPSTFEPTTVNPITDDSSTFEPTTVFTTEETTNDVSTSESTTIEPTSNPTTVAPTSEPTTATPIINDSTFWNPFTISMIVISCVVVLCVLGCVFYDIGKRKAAKQLPTIIIDDFEYLPKPSMVPRVKSVYGSSTIESFGKNNKYPYNV